MKYKSLVAYQKSYQLSLKLYEKTALFPRSELYGIVSQLRRASMSVPLNIAEGYCRGSKEYLHFLRISLGSCSEIDTLLNFSLDLKFLSNEDFHFLNALNNEVGKLLTTYINKLSINLR